MNNGEVTGQMPVEDKLRRLNKKIFLDKYPEPVVSSRRYTAKIKEMYFV